MSSAAHANRGPVLRARVARWMLAAIGVGLGTLGIVVPRFPTTVFLIVATWCFTRSCPDPERRLLRTRLFAPFLRHVDRVESVPARTKGLAIATMWFFVLVAAAFHPGWEDARTWVPAAIASAACVGTIAIVRGDTRRRAQQLLPEAVRRLHVDSVRFVTGRPDAIA